MLRPPGPRADAFAVDEDFVRRCRLAIDIVADSPAAVCGGAARGDNRLWHHFAVIAEAAASPEGPALTGSDPVDIGSAGIQTKSVQELCPVGDGLEASPGSAAVSHLLSEQVLLQLAGIQTKRRQEHCPVGAASLSVPQLAACGTGGA